tara:strand:+ start:62 stop:631 length:570 start_codon:yes stop_codon:yes gene_type:complete
MLTFLSKQYYNKKIDLEQDKKWHDHFYYCVLPHYMDKIRGKIRLSQLNEKHELDIKNIRNTIIHNQEFNLTKIKKYMMLEHLKTKVTCDSLSCDTKQLQELLIICNKNHTNVMEENKKSQEYIDTLQSQLTHLEMIKSAALRDLNRTEKLLLRRFEYQESNKRRCVIDISNDESKLEPGEIVEDCRNII